MSDEAEARPDRTAVVGMRAMFWAWAGIIGVGLLAMFAVVIGGA